MRAKTHEIKNVEDVQIKVERKLSRRKHNETLSKVSVSDFANLTMENERVL